MIVDNETRSNGNCIKKLVSRERTFRLINKRILSQLSKETSYQHTIVLDSAILVPVLTYGLLVVSITMNELLKVLSP